MINAGAFTHYAWSLHDALAAFDGPVVELHLSNPERGSLAAHVGDQPGGHGHHRRVRRPRLRLAIEAVAELLDATTPTDVGRRPARRPVGARYRPGYAEGVQPPVAMDVAPAWGAAGGLGPRRLRRRCWSPA